MEGQTKARALLTAKVGQMLKYRGLRDLLPPIAADGSSPFMVGLLDDTIRTVDASVRKLGGDAHVVMPLLPRAEDGLRVLILRVTAGRGERVSVAFGRPVLFEDIKLGTLTTLLRVGDGAVWHLPDHDTTFRFVNDSVQQDVG